MKYIKRIILQNFQSHKHTVVDFNEELNVIVGPSDSGKTAIIRGLKWVLYNEPSGDFFIREGEREASVIIEFSDNIKVKRLRSKSKNSYHLFLKDGEEMIYEGFGTNVPEEIIEAMEIKKINLDSDESASINLGEQLDGAFLLSEKTAVRASAIGRLVGVNVIDDALREGLRDNRNISSIRKNLDTTISELENELKQYDYLSEVSTKINKVEKIRNHIEEKINKRDKLELLYQNFNKTESTIEETEIYLKCLNKIENLDIIILKIQELYRNYKYYNNKKESYNLVRLNIKETSNITDKLKDLNITNEKYELLSQLLIRINNLVKLNNNIMKYKTDLDICNKTIKKLEHISKIGSLNTTIEMDLYKLVNLNKTMNNYKTNQDNIKKGNLYLKKFNNIDEVTNITNRISTSNTKNSHLEKVYVKLQKSNDEIEKSQKSLLENDLIMTKYLKEYRDLLSKQEVCPLCLSKIDEDKVDHIMEHYK